MQGDRRMRILGPNQAGRATAELELPFVDQGLRIESRMDRAASFCNLSKRRRGRGGRKREREEEKSNREEEEGEKEKGEGGEGRREEKEGGEKGGGRKQKMKGRGQEKLQGRTLQMQRAGLPGSQDRHKLLF